jgi:hypothetical protein
MTVVTTRAAARWLLLLAGLLGLLAALAGLVLAASASAAAGDEVWARTWKPAGTGRAASPLVAVAPTGRVYVAGYAVREGATDTDLFVACYTAAGKRKWVKYWGGAGDRSELPGAIAADAAGSVVVYGSSQDAGDTDWALVKFSAKGRLLWARTGGAPGGVMPGGLALDGKGNAYTTASAIGATTGVWCETLKHSPAGRKLWTRRHENMFGSFGKACVWYGSSLYVLAQDSLGNDPGIVTVVKYNAAGSEKWIRWWREGHEDHVRDITASRYGVAVTGFTADNRGILARFTHAGLRTYGEVWTPVPGAATRLPACGMSDAGDCFVAGGVSFQPAASPEFAVVRLTPDRLDAIRIAGQAGTAAEARDVVVTGGGKVYATGYRTNVPGGKVMVTAGWTGTPPWATTWTAGLGIDADGTSLALSSSAVFAAGACEDGRVVLVRYAR